MRLWDFILAPMSATASLRRAVRLTDRGDRKTAFPLLVRAARAGIPEAEFRIGRCYLEGAGVPPSRANGVRWLEKAATRGYVEAQALLATLCLNGMGPEQTGTGPRGTTLFSGPVSAAPNYEVALHWARRAAESGSAEAQAVVGFILGSGPENVRDQAASDEWYKRSAEAGCPQGQLGYALVLARNADNPETQTILITHLRAAADKGLA